MNRMGAYVWARRGVLAAFLGCVLIFWLVFSLYELPGEAVLYAALLSSIWLLGWVFGMPCVFRGVCAHCRSCDVI